MSIVITVVVLFSGYYLVRILFFGVIVSIEDEASPIKRSKEITKGQFWKVAVMLLIMSLIITPQLILYFGLPYIGVNKIVNEVITMPIVVVSDIYCTIIFLNVYNQIKK